MAVTQPAPSPLLPVINNSVAFYLVIYSVVTSNLPGQLRIRCRRLHTRVCSERKNEPALGSSGGRGATGLHRRTVTQYEQSFYAFRHLFLLLLLGSDLVSWQVPVIFQPEFLLTISQYKNVAFVRAVNICNNAENHILYRC